MTGQIRPQAASNQIVNTATVTYEDSAGTSYSAQSNMTIVNIVSGGKMVNISLALENCSLPAGQTGICSNLVNGKNYATTGASLMITQPGDNTVVLQKDDISIDNSGHVYFDLPTPPVAGNYNYKIKVNGYLIKAVKNIAFSDPINLDFGTLLAGDLKGDNNVVMGDFFVLSDKYGTDVGKVPPDFNQDGIVNMPDFLIFANNFSNTGD